jgi:hypothetical protein
MKYNVNFKHAERCGDMLLNCRIDLYHINLKSIGIHIKCVNNVV